MTVHIVRGDARKLPLADGTVDLVVTSPPFLNLRAYTDGGQTYDGQIGAGSRNQFLQDLWDVTAECARVLKPCGSIWVELGDSYTNKSLNLSPHRYAIGCTDRLGLILRSETIWCLSGGAKVYARMPTGDRPIMIRDLYRHYQPENVQLWNGERWTQVLGWNKTPAAGNALELELRTGERIGCTPNHQWPTNRGLLRADELRVGDIITTTRLPEPEEPRNPAYLPDDDIGWLVGLYIAEGSRSETAIQIAGHVKEDIRHARLARIAAALDATCNVYQTGDKAVTCNLYGTALVGVIERYVSWGTAHTKRLRTTAWQRSNRFLAAVVEGYLSGDGHYDAKNDRWRLGFCKNDDWAADLRTLAARLGAVVRLRRSSTTAFADTGGPRVFPTWHGEWRWTRSNHWNCKKDGEVVTIRNSRAREFYDIGVADDPHLFALASGVLTHNSRPNGLPESVTDRVRRSHSVWFHLVKQPRYYSAIDHIRQPHAASTQARAHLPRLTTAKYSSAEGRATGGSTASDSYANNPLGALPGSVWEVATEPLVVPAHLPQHFAAMPTAWPKKIILGWSPSGICTACGEGRRPVAQRDPIDPRHLASNSRQDNHERLAIRGVSASSILRTGLQSGQSPATRITGEVCGCPDTTAPTQPALILDPFGGTGTTALVGNALGRDAVSVDMSADYCRLATWRTSDPGQIAKVLGVAKPPVQLAGQTDLLAELDGGAA